MKPLFFKHIFPSYWVSYKIVLLKCSHCKRVLLSGLMPDTEVPTDIAISHIPGEKTVNFEPSTFQAFCPFPSLHNKC